MSSCRNGSCNAGSLLAFVLIAGFTGHALSARRVFRRPQLQPRSYRQTLHNFQNVQYYADFTIGRQNITGIFDTGSFELLVRSSRCTDCAHPTPPYDRMKSTSYGENGTVTKHVFGSGPCVSMMGYETVSVGPLSSEGQAFWEIMEHRIQVLDTAKFAAIVGIGPNFAYGNTERTLLMSYGIDEFSICLQKDSGSEGFLTWGPSDDALSPEDTVSASVIGKHHWVTHLRDVRFGFAGLQGACGAEDACAAIIDSGTSLIAAPGAALMQLSDQMPKIKEDCSNLHELPVLTFSIDGHPFELPPQAYVMRTKGATIEVDDIWDILFFKPKMRRYDMCLPAFMQLDMMSQHGPIWILGMPFFRHYHTTFDRRKEEMRFARAGEGCRARPLRAKHAANATAPREESLLAWQKKRSADYRPMEVEVDALIPPTLSGMMDFPYANKGELDL